MNMDTISGLGESQAWLISDRNVAEKKDTGAQGSARADSVEISSQKPEKIKVLEVDQWTSTGNIEQFTMDEFNIDRVSGGDSEAAKKIFGGYAAVREVRKEDSPHIGEVWYISDPQSNKLKFYKANYDSSD